MTTVMHNYIDIAYKNYNVFDTKSHPITQWEYKIYVSSKKFSIAKFGNNMRCKQTS